MSGRGESVLPPIHEVAEDLRDGADFDKLCDRYDVSEGTLRNRLSYAGYRIDGQPLHSNAAPRVPLIAEGNYISGGTGGGDYRGLPEAAVLHNRHRREFLGLDWSTSPARGPLWREV
jgi:hypothetical protein